MDAGSQGPADGAEPVLPRAGQGLECLRSVFALGEVSAALQDAPGPAGSTAGSAREEEGPSGGDGEFHDLPGHKKRSFLGLGEWRK
jgi:hypothetical protein